MRVEEEKELLVNIGNSSEKKEKQKNVDKPKITAFATKIKLFFLHKFFRASSFHFCVKMHGEF